MSYPTFVVAVSQKPILQLEKSKTDRHGDGWSENVIYKSKAINTLEAHEKPTKTEPSSLLSKHASLAKIS